ncbi:MAG: YjgP/YjgQ family permease [Cyanobacteria bacterium J083]|nr:MAG: YjgP/YjgQ family permease [Cyanobacteria bacterium J083]
MKLDKFPSWRSLVPHVSVMDRYLTRELLLPFFFGMGLFSSLTLAIGSLFDLVRKITESGLPISVAFQALFLRLPGFMVFAFPMAMLLATLMAYSRLSSDSELIALRSVGVSIYRIIMPAIVLSIVVTLVAFTFNNFLAPAATYQASVTIRQALGKSQPTFRESNIIYPEFQKVEQADGRKRTVLTRLFYAEQFDGVNMKGVTVLDRSKQGVSQIVSSQSASWNVKDNRWDFFNGIIYPISNNASYSEIIRFEHFQLDLPRDPLDIAKKSRDYDEMNLVQAAKYLEVVKVKGDERKTRKLRVRIQQKIAIPFVCLVFGLLGSAIGLQPQNTSRSTGFGICVGLVFAYYLLSFITSSLGVAGVFSPFLAAWLPNFLGLGATAWLMFRTSQQ